MSITQNQLHIMQHTLGLNEFGLGESYRNHYVASKGHPSYQDLVELTELGYMIKRVPVSFCKDDWFSVTESGVEAVKRESPKPPKLTRAQERYKRFLEVGDCFESFRHFLDYETHKNKMKRMGESL